jgi:hypothetical protein
MTSTTPAAASPMEQCWSTEFFSLLTEVEPLGTFATNGSIKSMPVLFPQVDVDGVGRLGFPFMESGLAQLKAVATPLGQVESLVDDTSKVSRGGSWRVDSSKVTLGGGEVWNEFLDDLLEGISRDLGISSKRMEDLGVKATFAELQIHEGGGAITSQWSTGTNDDVFGSLIIQLPSLFTGGTLAISHNGETKTLELSEDCLDHFKYMAFYSDCEYDITPVTSGVHLYLLLHLEADLSDQATKPSHSLNLVTASKLRSYASNWSSDEHAAKELGFPLDHEFGEEDDCDCYRYKHSIFGTLTGQDEIVFQTLKDAKCSRGRPLFDVKLVVMERLICSDRPGSHSTTIQQFDKDGNKI